MHFIQLYLQQMQMLGPITTVGAMSENFEFSLISMQ